MLKQVWKMVMLSLRDIKVLQAIVNDYIVSAEPVGSRTISKKIYPPLSPATIRNVMADLEDLGLLAQPHTSAGRIPTDKGFRFYVDSILKITDIAEKEREVIENTIIARDNPVDDVLKDLSKILAFISKQVAIVIAPRFNKVTLKHIEFIKLNRRKVLVILVSTTGQIQNRLIDNESQDMSQKELDKFANYLNGIISGLSISQIKEKILRETERLKMEYNLMLQKALEFGQIAINQFCNEISDVFIEGKTNLILQPEFSDIDVIRNIFQALEEKSSILSLLDETLRSEGVSVFIGSENSYHGMENLSIVVSPYRKENMILGSIGVIGPIRMNYNQVIPIVDYTARFISKILQSS